MIRILGCVVVAAMGLPASALDVCPTPEKLLQPARSFEDVLAAMPSQAPKGEFESTAAYEARRSTARPPSEELVEIRLLSDFKYNADRQAFEYFEYAFGSITMLDDLNGLSSEARAQFNFDYKRPVALSVRYERKTVGSYEGQNAYGATSTVEKVQTTQQIIFDNLGRKGLNGDTPFAEYKDYKERYLSIPVSIDRAPAVKSQLRAVALIAPKAPYSAAGFRLSSPTRSLPIEATSNVLIMFADIKCVGVLDGEGQLLVSWSTR